MAISVPIVFARRSDFRTVTLFSYPIFSCAFHLHDQRRDFQRPLLYKQASWASRSSWKKKKFHFHSHLLPTNPVRTYSEFLEGDRRFRRFSLHRHDIFFLIEEREFSNAVEKNYPGGDRRDIQDIEKESATAEVTAKPRFPSRFPTGSFQLLVFFVGF